MGLVAAGLLNAESTAHAARPAVYAVPAGTTIPQPAGLGLFVPGAGGTVTREGAIASLQRGKVKNAALGGTPSGKILVDVVFGAPKGAAARPLVYVELPPPGRHANTKRYRVAIVGAGYSGILVSDATRIRGLVAIADIAPTLVALREGRAPPIHSEPDADVTSDLHALDVRLTRIHRDRGWTLVIVVLTVLALIAAAPRAAVVAPASAIGASLLLSWAGATRFWLVLVSMAGLTVALALAASVRRSLVPPAVAVFLLVFTVVLAADPELNSLAVLGARPDGGGRFYGIGNQVETLLLPPVIAALAMTGFAGGAALLVLALVTVGWSKAGADGGGLLVFATAFAVLTVRRYAIALTPRRVLLLAAAVASAVLAFVGLDAALGGSSHVTHAVGTGPGSLLGDLGHRLHLSWASATDHWYRIAIFVACVAVLVWMGTRRPRRATVDALLAALAISLLVNDTPVDVIGLGTLGCAALLRWESVDSRTMRRGALTVGCAFAALALSGCGNEGVVSPVPKQVVGTVKQESPGKAVFITQACGSCHTYEPAGPEANGMVGPDLDKLPEYAKVAGQPLATFVHDSIVDPNKYVEKGYPKNVMPKSYKSLPPSDLKDLVDFLSKPQG